MRAAPGVEPLVAEVTDDPVPRRSRRSPSRGAVIAAAMVVISATASVVVMWWAEHGRGGAEQTTQERDARRFALEAALASEQQVLGRLESERVSAEELLAARRAERGRLRERYDDERSRRVDFEHLAEHLDGEVGLAQLGLLRAREALDSEIDLLAALESCERALDVALNLRAVDEALFEQVLGRAQSDCERAGVVP